MPIASFPGYKIKSGNEATLAHLALWVFSISLFLDHSYSMIWLGDGAPLLATLNIIAVPFFLQEWLKFYNMAFSIKLNIMADS